MKRMQHRLKEEDDRIGISDDILGGDEIPGLGVVDDDDDDEDDDEDGSESGSEEVQRQAPPPRRERPKPGMRNALISLKRPIWPFMVEQPILKNLFLFKMFFSCSKNVFKNNP